MDMAQFQASFLEEAGENLSDLESGLLELEAGASADMNAIFRAAHSIKGGAGTFGFNLIAAFTHTAEELLEHARDGKIEVTPDLVTELLKACDVIGELLNNAKNGNLETQASDQARCLSALKTYLNSPAAATPQQQTQSTDGLIREQRIMNVTFKPLPHLPQTGCEPQNILRELAELGDAEVTCHLGSLPALPDLNIDELYLWWEVELATDATDEEIEDIFMFVEGDAEIEISMLAAFGPIDTGNMPSTTVEATPAGERRDPVNDRRKQDRRQPEAQAEKQSSYIRVAIDKVDHLLNLIGELVTTNAMVTQHVSHLNEDDHAQLHNAGNEMARHTRNLQEAIMSIRMMPVDFAFNRFPRMVRDTAQKLGKEVRLEMSGTQTELDKTVIEKIADPLTHLVRNSVDHGIELPEERQAAGKSPEGTVMLAAYYRGGNVVIEIRDDGRGLNRDKILNKAIEKNLCTAEAAQTLPDEDVWNFIFHSGFSTADKVTDVSGRGVGMDVVRKNIQALGGSVNIKSEAGKGSVFSIVLPLTLAILDGMATQVGDEIYIIPLLSILESLRPTSGLIKTMQDNVEVLDFRGEYIPILRIAEVMRVTGGNPIYDLSMGIAVIVETELGKAAVFVDDLLGERQVVIKSIEKNYSSVEGLSGATILGDGRVAMILDLAGLVRVAQHQGRYLRKHQPKASAIPAFNPEQPHASITT